MKTKREILRSVQDLYLGYVRVWSFVNFGANITVKLIPNECLAKEEHYLIANAANKYWNLLVE